MEKMNISDISTIGGVLTFILLPEAKRLDLDKELPDRYATLTKLLIAQNA